MKNYMSSYELFIEKKLFLEDKNGNFRDIEYKFSDFKYTDIDDDIGDIFDNVIRNDEFTEIVVAGHLLDLVNKGYIDFGEMTINYTPHIVNKKILDSLKTSCGTKEYQKIIKGNKTSIDSNAAKKLITSLLNSFKFNSWLNDNLSNLIVSFKIIKKNFKKLREKHFAYLDDFRNDALISKGTNYLSYADSKNCIVKVLQRKRGQRISNICLEEFDMRQILQHYVGMGGYGYYETAFAIEREGLIKIKGIMDNENILLDTTPRFDDYIKSKQQDTEKSKVLVKFPTQEKTMWEDVTMELIDDETMTIFVGKVHKRVNYAEMGLADRRRGLSNMQWKTLKVFAKHNGTISWESSGKSFKIQKRIQALRRNLKNFIDINDDPFYRYKDKMAYVAKFKIKDVSYSKEHEESLKPREL